MAVPPLQVGEQEPCEEFVYATAPWSICTRDCGGGIQSRRVYCARVEEGEIWGPVRHFYCQALDLEAPPSERPCNTDVCKSEIVVWTVKSVGPCDPPLCGGTRVQVVVCEYDSCSLPSRLECEKCTPLDLNPPLLACCPVKIFMPK
jgi:hypothetical protein